MFSKFLSDNLDNARTYSDKDDQAIIDDVLKGLGLSQNTGEQLLRKLALRWLGKKQSRLLPQQTPP